MIYKINDKDSPYFDYDTSILYVLDNNFADIEYQFRSDHSLSRSNIIDDIFPKVISDIIMSLLYCYHCKEPCFRNCDIFTRFRKRIYIA